MKLTILIFLIYLFNGIGFLTESLEKLSFLQTDKKITDEQFRIFSIQLDHRTRINLQSRLDSMKIWDLDILYLEEYYFPKQNDFLVKEFYFSSKSEKEGGKSEYDKYTKVYRPEKYYENAKIESKYFFDHEKSKENLASIRKHMKTRTLIDQISPLVKKEVIHAGCGMSGKQIEMERESVEKKYNKPQTPDYYLIETIMEKNDFTISFQIPIRTKYQVIVEGHSF